MSFGWQVCTMGRVCSSSWSYMNASVDIPSPSAQAAEHFVTSAVRCKLTGIDRITVPSGGDRIEVLTHLQ